MKGSKSSLLERSVRGAVAVTEPKVDERPLLRTELFYDRGNHHEFLSLSQELAAPGELRQAQTFDFGFKNVEKQFESYQGINVKLRSAARPVAI
jgi:hypothetical protein